MIQYNYRTMTTDAVRRALDAAAKANLGHRRHEDAGRRRQLPGSDTRRPSSRSSSTRASRSTQAAIKTVFADQRIHAVVSEMTNRDMLRENIGRQPRPHAVTLRDQKLLEEYRQATAHLYCHGCGQHCEPAAGGVAVADILRYLRYHEVYGKRQRARELYQALSPEARDIAARRPGRRPGRLPARPAGRRAPPPGRSRRWAERSLSSIRRGRSRRSQRRMPCSRLRSSVTPRTRDEHSSRRPSSSRRRLRRRRCAARRDGILAVDPAAEVDQPAASEQNGNDGRSSSAAISIRLGTGRTASLDHGWLLEAAGRGRRPCSARSRRSLAVGDGDAESPAGFAGRSPTCPPWPPSCTSRCDNRSDRTRTP